MAQDWLGIGEGLAGGWLLQVRGLPASALVVLRLYSYEAQDADYVCGFENAPVAAGNEPRRYVAMSVTS